MINQSALRDITNQNAHTAANNNPQYISSTSPDTNNNQPKKPMITSAPVNFSSKQLPGNQQMEDYSSMEPATHKSKTKTRQHYFHMAMHFLQQKEYKQAETFFQKAAALGCSSALYRLGIIYMSDDLGEDREVIYSYRKAFECFAQAGNMGHSGAVTNIGTLFFNAGKYEEAMQYYARGASMGCVYAYKNIGKMYESGHGVPKDNTTALQYFRKCGSDRHIQRATRNVLNETCYGAI